VKKFLALVLGMLFVLAFTAISYADNANITLGGEIKQWNWMRDNMSGTGLSGNLPTDTTADALSMTRVRIGADIKVADNVKGMIELESSGGAQSSDFYTWGTLNAKQSGINFRQAWILYTGSGLLGIPTGLKTGHMLLALGHNKFFNNTRYGDDAIVLFVDPNKQLHIGVLTFKVSEGSFSSNSNADDVDVYAAVMTYKLDDKNNFGLNYVRVNDPEVNAGLRQFQNVMLHGGFDISGLILRTEIDLQFGKLNKATPTTKAAGYLVYIDAGYKVDVVGLRAAYANGSGDNNAGDNKNKNFINFLGPDMNVGSFMYEYQIRSASGGGSTSGLTNTVMYNIGLDYNATKDLGLGVDGYLFRANKVASGVSKKVGTEIDLKSKYNVAKGLTWTILAGYFSPGQFYKDSYGAEKKSSTALRSDLTLNF